MNDNGLLTLIYTGHVWLQGVGNNGAIRQVQCIATSEDGLYFNKHGAIVTPPDGIMHFRDPKVWKQNGRWFMMVGARDTYYRGQVLLYSGTSLFQWSLEGVLAKADRWLGISALQAEIHMMWNIQKSQADRFGIEIVVSDVRR